MEKTQSLCTYCREEIKPGERRYYSRQAGMRGNYHWDCFVNACRQANRAGANEIETISVGDESFNGFSNVGYDLLND